MGTTVTGQFETRREAEMTVERLVQEYQIERSDIFIVASGSQDTAGNELAGSDTEAGKPSDERRNDAALNGPVVVSVDIDDEAKQNLIRKAFDEFSAHDVETK